jgi:D-alanyl-lipoteichoic acid acyltransferase DltB (MBOAT superfamily)
MLFNTLTFVGFFIVVFGLYVVLNHRRQNILLLVSSYIFYGAWDYRFLLLLMLSTCIDWAVGLAIAKQQTQQERKFWLVVSLITNLGILGFFKYFNFFADGLVELAGVLGMSVSPVTLQIILPVGVSFYTFQSMSYTIEIYRGRLEPRRSLFEFAVYVSFFPQLVAGPIERATNLIQQVITPRVVTLEKIGSGISLIILGFFKKVVMADNLAPTVAEIFSKGGGYTGQEVLIGALFFAFQIYGDFSGYTDIARGIARMLGFELMMNFRQPYFARDPSDFWGRWHISLSSWLRDYLYISLGGNRGSRSRTYRNLMLTMLLGGLWHGAAWNFVLWGLFHGLLLVGYRIYSEYRPGVAPQDRSLISTIVATTVMFVFTLYGWLLFRAESGTQIIEMTAALGNFTAFQPIASQVAKLLFFAWPVLLLDYIQFRARDDEPALMRFPLAAQAVGYTGLLIMFVMLGQYEGASFIYFQF